MPGYLAFCVYVCNGEHEENYEKGCISATELKMMMTKKVMMIMMMINNNDYYSYTSDDSGSKAIFQTGLTQSTIDRAQAFYSSQLILL